MHALSQEEERQDRACAIKLDMAKAYDRVEWNYLRGTMLRLGFAESFVNTVMRCVTSVAFSVRVNGNLSIPFRPTRGIHQGDPISLYLFFLCSEGLSYLLNAVGPLYLSRGIWLVYMLPGFHIFGSRTTILFF
jgi:hypothetical protein